MNLRQANCSVSAIGVLRGLHFAELPPSQAKYVTCLRGSLLDDRDRRSIYLAEGLAHGFLALQDDSTVRYLCSSGYDPEHEHSILATDPAIGIDWPAVPGGVLMSERDRDAPTLDQVHGLLPTWEAASAYVEWLRRRRATE